MYGMFQHLEYDKYPSDLLRRSGRAAENGLPDDTVGEEIEAAGVCQGREEPDHRSFSNVDLQKYSGGLNGLSQRIGSKPKEHFLFGLPLTYAVQMQFGSLYASRFRDQ